MMYRLYKRLVNLLLLPVILHPLFNRHVGRDYRLGFWSKIWLLYKSNRVVRTIQSATAWREHILLITSILKIPASVEGAIVECGCFKGASTTTLSLVCSMTNRRLLVFDSFQGLPTPSEVDQRHYVPILHKNPEYHKGEYTGGLEEVKRNISRFGSIRACTFFPGYYQESLPKYASEFRDKIAFIFLDVDLLESLQTCLQYLWPQLQPNCRLFTHEAHHLEMSSVFFDKPWWKERLNDIPPGLVGAGLGLSYDSNLQSPIGYTIKHSAHE